MTVTAAGQYRATDSHGPRPPVEVRGRRGADPVEGAADPSRDGQIRPPTAGYEGERKGVAVGVVVVMLMLGTQGPHRRPGRGSPAST